MLELIAILTPLILADVINPALVAATVFALGTLRPYRGALWVLMGWFAVYSLAGIAVSFGLARLARLARESPAYGFFVIQLVVGVWLVWLSYQTARGADQRASRHMPQTGAGGSHTLSAGAGILLGATIALVGLGVAAPYFAAIGQMLKAQMSWSESLLAIGFYNLALAVPFVALMVARSPYGDHPEELFGRVNRTTQRAAAIVKPLLLFVAGAALLIDAAYYLTSGRPLIGGG